MNPSERIKAALSRPEAMRPRRSSPTLEPPADVETALPLLGDATRAASRQASAVDSAAKVETAPPARPESKLYHTRRIYLAVAALVLIAFSAVVIRARMSTAPKQTRPSPNLQVVVKPEGNGLLSVGWNPQSAIIARAREGRLVIQEANQQPKVVQLQAQELKAGHVYYESSAERLEFRLEVVDAAGAVVKESVLAVPSGTAASEPSPPPSQTAQVPSPATKPQIATNTDPKADRRLAAVAPETAAPVKPIPDVPAPSQPAPRTFTPPPTPTREPAEEARAVVLDPSPSLPGGITAPARVNLPQLSVLPAPAVKAPVSKASPGNGQVTTGGNVEPATLLKRVAPVYPAIARSARIQGTVRFTATVDKYGKLQKIQFMNGPQMLVQAASDAVKKWVYRPMMLNGQPTEVITQIEVKFSLAP